MVEIVLKDNEFQLKFSIGVEMFTSKTKLKIAIL